MGAMPFWYTLINPSARNFTVFGFPLETLSFVPPAPNRLEEIFPDLPIVNMSGGPLRVYYQIAVGGDSLLVRSENFAQVALDSISDY